MPTPPLPRLYAFLFLILLLSPQAARSTPLVAKPDEEFGCRPFNANVPAQLANKNPGALAQENCRDYQANPLFKQSNRIRAAREKCVGFYTLAHKLMNSFCSYQHDMQAVAEKAGVIASSEGIGQAKNAEAGEAEILGDLVAINLAYQKKVGALASKFHDTFPQYISAIGQMNGEGMANEGFETHYCKTGRVDSAIPGITQQALAAVSHANATLTYENMFQKATRPNMKLYQRLSTEAGAKKFIADLRASGLGEATTGSIASATLPTAGSNALRKENPGEPLAKHLSGGEAAARVIGQTALTKAMEHYIPNALLKAPVPAIIGGSIVAVYVSWKNKRIMYPETAAAIVGMVNPIAGGAVSVVVALYRGAQKSAEALRRYQSFVGDKVRQEIEISSHKLVEEYALQNGDSTCVKRIRARVACLQANPARAYDHSCGR